ncbi:MAG: hypothetical protein KDB80_02405 [Planctomycetes bacterium]|nr:hypothetical protein [Planctomycetota bacterium]
MSRIVYDSARGRMCPDCHKVAAHCVCARIRAQSVPEGDGVVRVRREVRSGKELTTASGIPLVADDLRKLAKEWKKKCGSGGKAKDGVIEIQGDHRDFVVADLENRGYRVKLAGG